MSDDTPDDASAGEDGAEAAPIKDLAGLRKRLDGRELEEPATAAIGAPVLAMFIGLPVVNWLVTDQSIFSGLLGGFGWWLLFALAVLVATVVGDAIVGEHKGWVPGLIISTLVMGGFSFLTYGHESMLAVAALTAAIPIAGLLSYSSSVRKRRQQDEEGIIGLTDDTVAALVALPDDLIAAIRTHVDSALADTQTIDRFVQNGMLARSGQSVAALRGDVDRAMAALARKALVADTMVKRGDDQDARPLRADIDRLVADLDHLADAALVAAAAADTGAPVDLSEHVENLRLATAGQREIARDVEDATAG